MKALGLILVAVGGLVLGFTELGDGPPDTSRQLFAGIAVVLGLILLASGRRTVN